MLTQIIPEQRPYSPGDERITIQWSNGQITHHWASPEQIERIMP